MAKNVTFQDLIFQFFEPHLKTFIEEKGYDQLRDLVWWQKIAQLRKKYPQSGNIIIGLLEILTQQWKPSSPIGNLASDILVDMPAELQRRLIDGLKNAKHYEKLFFTLLKPEFKDFISWWKMQDESTQSAYFSAIAEMTEPELNDFLAKNESEKLSAVTNCAKNSDSIDWQKLDRTLARGISQIAKQIKSRYTIKN